jgi:hypothetical protein
MLSSNILNILFIRLTFKTENSRSWKDENTNLRHYEQRSSTTECNPLHNDLLVTVQINIPNDKQ